MSTWQETIIPNKPERYLRLANNILSLFQPAYLVFLAQHKDNLSDNDRDRTGDYLFILALLVKIGISIGYKIAAFNHSDNERDRFGSGAPCTILTQDTFSLLKSVVALIYAGLLAANKDTAFIPFVVVMCINFIVKGCVAYIRTVEENDLVSHGGIFKHSTFNRFFLAGDLACLITVSLTHANHDYRPGLYGAAFILAIPMLMKLYEDLPVLRLCEESSGAYTAAAR